MYNNGGENSSFTFSIFEQDDRSGCIEFKKNINYFFDKIILIQYHVQELKILTYTTNIKNLTNDF